MTDSPNNITHLRGGKLSMTPGAIAARKSRAKKNEQKRVAAIEANVIEGAITLPSVKPTHDDARLTFSVFVLLAALGIAGVSAFFSITGMTHVFSGNFWAITAMGVALELARLTAIAWLGRRHGAGPLRIMMIFLVAILMALSAIGSFGFLSAAHITRVTADQAAIDHHAAQADADIAVQADAVADLDHQVAQIDDVIRAATLRGRTQSALTIIADQSRTRADLVARRRAAAEKLAEFKVRKSEVAGERRAVEADLGPVKYLATLIGTDADTAMKWFIVLVAGLLDPLACALLLAATTARRAS